MLKCLFCKHRKQCKYEFDEIKRQRETIEVLTIQVDEYERELQKVQFQRDKLEDELKQIFAE